MITRDSEVNAFLYDNDIWKISDVPPPQALPSTNYLQINPSCVTIKHIIFLLHLRLTFRILIPSTHLCSTHAQIRHTLAHPYTHTYHKAVLIRSHKCAHTRGSPSLPAECQSYLILHQSPSCFLCLPTHHNPHLPQIPASIITSQAATQSSDRLHMRCGDLWRHRWAFSLVSNIFLEQLCGRLRPGIFSFLIGALFTEIKIERETLYGKC